jgi:signal transduction histidine kinase/CheY-like chemotaxis protein
MSNRPSPYLDDELRLPHQSLLLATAVLGLALVAVDPLLPTGREAIALAGILLTAAVAAWLLGRWLPDIAPWFSALVVVFAVIALRFYCGWPGLLTLLILPTALMGAMVTPRAAATLAALETGALLLLRNGAIERAEFTLAIIAVWAGAVLIVALHYPVQQLALWSWTQFEQGQKSLDEARERQSQLKDTLDALGHANQQLNLANQRMGALRAIAEEAERSKASFVANVSHEFRTPLNIIIGLTELLVDARSFYRQELPPAVARDIEVIHRNSEHLASMVNDVLDLSQVEAGEMALQRRWVAMGDLVRAAVAIVEPLILEKGLGLELDLDEQLPPIWCDPRRIRQVVLNLLSNAARFTERGGIRVVVTALADSLSVSVTDTGPGLAEGDADRIFEPFRQGSAHSAARGQGSGLGLAISKQFIAMHQGSISVESTLGLGSTFSFRLPLTPAEGPHAPVERWLTDGWAARRTRARVAAPELGKRLLFIDPSGAIQPVLDRYAHDLTLVPATSLGDAQRKVAASAAQGVLLNVPDAATLWPALEAAIEALPDYPVLACVLPPAEERALAAGAHGHLLKPLDQEMLAAALGTVTPSPRKVLIVDDEPDALDLLARLLQRCDPDLEIVKAASGRETLERMAADRPDLVLLDLLLPDIDGWEVLLRVQADAQLCLMPIVLVSAQDPRERPLTSLAIAGGRARGLSLTMLLRCAQALSTLMMQPD